jgi:hypothetical protein
MYGETHPLISNNEELNLEILISFIEKHPEDAEKWLEHLDPIFNPAPISYLKRNNDIALTEEQVNRNFFTEDTPAEVPRPDTGCSKCKRTWASTTEHPTMNLLCGHKFHTVCYLMAQYEDDAGRCSVEGCNYDSWGIIRRICRKRERLREEARNTFLRPLDNNEEFKRDVAKMSQYVKDYKTARGKLEVRLKNVRTDVVKKHIFAIRQIHGDLNDSVKRLKESESMKNTLSALRKFRVFSRSFHRKYHLSLRDLIRRNYIKDISWNHRSVLERHHGIMRTTYRFQIRINPGRQLWSRYHEDGGVADAAEPENEIIAPTGYPQVEDYIDSDSEIESDMDSE